MEVPAERSGAACPDGAVTAGDWGWTDEGRKTFRAAPEQWRCRRSEAEPHAPTGLSPSGDWGWTDEGRKTFRAAPERQRGFRKETEAAQVPAERSGAACPDGAVTVR